MDKISQSWNSKLTKWLRWLHRDLGYFIVGISVIYAVSGLILNHRGDHDPAYSVTVVEKSFPPDLDRKDFRSYWQTQAWDYKLIKILHEDSTLRLFLKGGVGKYNSKSGKLRFEVYKKRPLVAFVNKLHFNQKKGWVIFADIFAVSIIVLAVSGIFLVKGKNGFLRRGIWIVLAGIAAVVAFAFI